MSEPFDRHVRDPQQVRLLSSAVRQEIVDTLAALGGEASVAAIAGHLGRPADGLYYHLRALADGGLVEEAAADREERRYRLAGEGGPLRLVYDLGPQGNGRELGAFARALLQIAGQDFEDALTARSVATEGPERELWVSRNKGWLSKADLREVSGLLERLSVLTSQPKAGGRERLISLAFALAPVSPRPKRRQKGAVAARHFDAAT